MLGNENGRRFKLKFEYLGWIDRTRRPSDLDVYFHVSIKSWIQFIQQSKLQYNKHIFLFLFVFPLWCLKVFTRQDANWNWCPVHLLTQNYFCPGQKILSEAKKSFFIQFIDRWIGHKIDWRIGNMLKFHH